MLLLTRLFLGFIFEPLNINETMNIQESEIFRASHSWDGVALPAYPNEKPELIVKHFIFPARTQTEWHHHTVINYGIVRQGELTIVCEDGNERTFHKEEVIVEVIGTIHRGENRGSKPVELDMFYISVPNEIITIQHPDFILRQERRNQSIEEQPKGNCLPPKPISREEDRVFKLVKVIGKQSLPRRQLVEEMKMKPSSRHTFINNYLRPAYLQGYITFAYPGSPHKPAQTYRLTAKGLELYAALTTGNLSNESTD